MFDIRITKPGELMISGRFDAISVDRAREVLDQVTASSTVDLKHLDYMSSAGIGILLAAQKRLLEKGHKLTLINVSSHMRDLFLMTRLDTVFEIVDVG